VPARKASCRRECQIVKALTNAVRAPMSSAGAKLSCALQATATAGGVGRALAGNWTTPITVPCSIMDTDNCRPQRMIYGRSEDFRHRPDRLAVHKPVLEPFGTPISCLTRKTAPSRGARVRAVVDPPTERNRCSSGIRGLSLVPSSHLSMPSCGRPRKLCGRTTDDRR
jgi:hypothetical protein